MQITLELPEGIAQGLESRWKETCLVGHFAMQVGNLPQDGPPIRGAVPDSTVFHAC